jgi:hypothetical protein
MKGALRVQYSITAVSVSFLILIGLLPFSLLGCEWTQSKKYPVIVIAVESLAFESVRCDTPQASGGFKTLCEEAVRFTHAFTPSVMSQAALVSVLTGEYPFQHGVRHNGDGQFLSSEKVTLAELARKQGYRTAFYTGGAPILRKSGLAQGFEIFDEHYGISHKRLYRSADTVFKSFYKWRELVGGKSFFATFYLADTQFPDQLTRTTEGEARQLGYGSQLQEVGESLEQFFSYLRQNNLWSRSTVVVLGLNGAPTVNRVLEPRGLNLHGENVQVALFYKPSHKKRDLGREWKIDRNVSLVDLGWTLRRIFSPDAPKSLKIVKGLEVVSLESVLDKVQVDWSAHRIIPFESGWGEWQGLSGMRVGMRRGHLHMLYDEKLRVYNTLIDRLEQRPLKTSDPIVERFLSDAREFIENQQVEPWVSPPSTLLQKVSLGQRLWRSSKVSEEDRLWLRQLSFRRPFDRQLKGWRARVALVDKDWPELVSLGKASGQESWQVLGRLWQGEELNKKLSGCLGMTQLQSVSNEDKKACGDPVFLSLWRWVNSHPPSQVREDQFVRKYRRHHLDEKLHKLNFVNGLTWSMSHQRPALIPEVDIFLNFPENEKYLRRLQKRMD